MGLYKRGSVWWVRFQYQGAQVRRSTYTADKREAERVERQMRERYRQQRLGGRPRRTFNEALEKWAAEVWPVLKESSMRRYSVSSEHLARRFSGVHLHEIDKRRIAEFVSARRAGGVKQATIRRDLAALSSMLSFAVSLDWIEHNPVTPAVKKGLRESAPRVRWLTRDQFAELLDAAAPRSRAPIEFAAETGLRFGEQFGLTWDRVDLDRREVYIVGTKTGTPRMVPLSDRAVAILRSQPRFLRCPLVFWRAQGRPYTNSPRGLKGACQRAGIKDFRWHDLRHTFASWKVQDGMDLYTLSLILGHSTMQMTRRYAHLATEHLHERMAGTRYKTVTDTVDSSQEEIANGC